MANQKYDNFVLSSKITDITNSAISVFPLMVVDTSLTTEPGMKRIINTYTYAGESEELAMGQGNTKTGAVTMTPNEYIVKLAQQRFVWHDEEEMTDPLVVDTGIDGIGKSMANEFRKSYFTEVAKTTTVHEYEGVLKYDDIVDGLAKFDLESEEGIFVIINNTNHKAELRKDPDYKAIANGEKIVSGHIGFIAGIPVLESRLIVDPIIATKEAVTCFMKKESEAEQEREANTRKNTIYGRRVNLVALTDARKAIKLTKKVGETSLKAKK